MNIKKISLLMLALLSTAQLYSAQSFEAQGQDDAGAISALLCLSGGVEKSSVQPEDSYYMCEKEGCTETFKFTSDGEGEKAFTLHMKSHIEKSYEGKFKGGTKRSFCDNAHNGSSNAQNGPRKKICFSGVPKGDDVHKFVMGGSAAPSGLVSSPPSSPKKDKRAISRVNSGPAAAAAPDFGCINYLLPEKIRDLFVKDPSTDRVLCPECDKTFVVNGAAYKHYRAFHTEEKGKKYTCRECEKSFTREFDLRNHSNVHLPVDHPDSKVYACPYCSDVFVIHSNRNSHVRRSHNDEEGQKGKEQLENYSGVKSKTFYKCGICPNVYTAFEGLKIHCKKKHSVVIRKMEEYKTIVGGPGSSK